MSYKDSYLMSQLVSEATKAIQSGDRPRIEKATSRFAGMSANDVLSELFLQIGIITVDIDMDVLLATATIPLPSNVRDIFLAVENRNIAKLKVAVGSENNDQMFATLLVLIASLRDANSRLSDYEYVGEVSARVESEQESPVVYDEDKHFLAAMEYSENTSLTPTPKTLTIHWSHASSYYFDEVFDGSSLVWIQLMMDSFREAFSGMEWMVDDPGTLYVNYENGVEIDYDDFQVSPFSMEKLQEVSDVVLARYASLSHRLVAAGIRVVDES